MKKLTMLLAAVAILLLPRAAWGQTAFQKTFGSGTAYCIKKTSDGNLIIAGGPMFLMKMDLNGGVLWHKSYSTTAGGADASAVEQTSDGGYIVSGTLNGGGPTSKVILMKADSDGNFQWSKTYGGASYEFGNDVKQTLDGGYIAVGYTASFGQLIDVYLIKTDSNGDTLWSRNFGEHISDFDYGYSVSQRSDSSYVIGGQSGNIITNSHDIAITKLDKKGNLLWSKCYGGSGDDEAYSLIHTSDGGYAALGFSDSFGAGLKDPYLIKVDSAGNLNWSKTYGGPGNDYGYSLSATSSGGFVLTSTYDNLSAADIFLTEINSVGDTAWTKIYGDNGSQADIGYSSIKEGNNFFSVGVSNSFSGMYVIKTDSSGKSGCNQSNQIITVTTPSTAVTTPSITVSSPATVVNSISFSVSNISTVSTLCSLVSVNEITEPFDFNSAKLVGIYDLMGQEVTNNFQKPDGLYIYRYEDKQKQFCSKKVMIVH